MRLWRSLTWYNVKKLFAITRLHIGTMQTLRVCSRTGNRDGREDPTLFGFSEFYLYPFGRPDQLNAFFADCLF